MSKCQHEIEAMKVIRRHFPNQAQRSLATDLTNNRFDALPWYPQEAFDAAMRIKAGYATTYNRIRRIDGSIK